jgi:uncharacterized protein
MSTVAVLGASSDRAKFGNKALRAFQMKGFTVYAVNPNETDVEGMQCYPSVRDLPVRPDIITVYVRPNILLKLLPEIAEKGCERLWLNPGTASTEVLNEAKRLCLPAVQGCSIIAIGADPYDI